MATRRLSLHASALTDDEYAEYTASLRELAEIDCAGAGQGEDGDDEYYEGITLGVREVRAWVRGRNPSITSSTVDTILKFFSPNLAHGDTLTGGQVFAILRLVAHAREGRDVDRGLAFVQARPTRSRSSSPSKRKSSSQLSTQTNPYPPPPPRRSNTMVSSLEHAQPPQHPSSTNPSASSSIPNQAIQPSSSSTNPFVLARSKPKPPLPPPISSRSEDGTSVHSTNSNLPTASNTLRAGPPLPPRKSAPANQTAFLPPPKHTAASASSSSSSTPAPTYSSHGYHVLSSHPHPPTTPAANATGTTKGGGGYVTSNLMKQSLQAGKVGATMKKAEEMLEKERVMRVLKSSSSTGLSGSTPFRSSNPPPVPSSNTKPSSNFPLPPPYTNPASHSSASTPRPIVSSRSRDQSPSAARQAPPPPPRKTDIPPSSSSTPASSSSSPAKRRSIVPSSNMSSSSASDYDMNQRSTGSTSGFVGRPPAPPQRLQTHRRQGSFSAASASSLEQVALASNSAIGARRVGNHDESRPREGSVTRSGGGVGVGLQRSRHVSAPGSTAGVVSRGSSREASPFGSPIRQDFGESLPPPPPVHPDRSSRSGRGLEAITSASSATTSFDAVYGGDAVSTTSASGASVFETPLPSPGGQWSPLGSSPFASGSTASLGTTTSGSGGGGGGSPSSPRARVFRSRSMHQTGSPLLYADGESPFGPSSPSSPLATSQFGGGGGGTVTSASRRKRPESMQVGMGWMGRRMTLDEVPGSGSLDRGEDKGKAKGVEVENPFRSPFESSSTVGGGIGIVRGGAGLSRHVSLGGRGFVPGGDRGGAHRKGSASVSSNLNGVETDGSGISMHANHHSRNVHSTSTSANHSLHPPHSHSHSTSTSTPSTSHTHTTSTSHSYTGYPTPTASPLSMKTMLSTLTSQSRSKTEALGERITERLEAMKPGLEKAVYKAEAGLNVRRGYVPSASAGGHRSHSNSRGKTGREDEKEGLMGGTRGGEDGYDEYGEDAEDGSDEGSVSGRRRGQRERDELKWPVAPDEGWKPL